jgi:HAD superfamily hydrolase (TIGR01509 family)
MTETHSKAIIFDLGKVLLHFDFGIAAKNLARHADATAEEILAQINQTPHLHAYERGEVSSEAFYRNIGTLCGYQESFEVFRNDFADIFEEWDVMVEFMRSLKSEQVPVMVFSNTNEIAVSFIRETFPFFSEFDHHCYSYEHGMMKPTSALYEKVEHILERQGRDLFFIDDKAENVEAAIARGWSGQIHVRPEETIPAVKKWLNS